MDDFENLDGVEEGEAPSGPVLRPFGGRNPHGRDPSEASQTSGRPGRMSQSQGNFNDHLRVKRPFVMPGVPRLGDDDGGYPPHVDSYDDDFPEVEFPLSASENATGADTDSRIGWASVGDEEEVETGIAGEAPPENRKSRRALLLGWADMQRAAKNLRVPIWGQVMRGDLIIHGGQPGVGKSLYTLQELAAIAAGAKFAGYTPIAPAKAVRRETAH
jgi:hypothetical protein